MSTTTRSLRHRCAAATLSLGLIVAVAGCGSDSEGAASSPDKDATTTTAEATTTTEAVDADLASFCETFLTIDGKAASADTESAEGAIALAKDIQADVDTLRETVPGDLETDFGVLDAGVSKALGGDAEAINTDEFNAAVAKIEGYLHESCGYQKVDITAVDYGFDGMPETLEAGKTSFAMENKTTHGEFHVAVLVKLKDGVDLTAEELLALPEEESMTKADVIAGMGVPPTQTSGTLADLEPGTYVVFCPVPVGSGEDGPPHFTEGMVKEFTVG